MRRDVKHCPKKELGYSLDIVLVQQAEVLLEQPQVALQGIFIEGKV